MEVHRTGRARILAHDPDILEIHAADAGVFHAGNVPADHSGNVIRQRCIPAAGGDFARQQQFAAFTAGNLAIGVSIDTLEQRAWRLHLRDHRSEWGIEIHRRILALCLADVLPGLVFFQEPALDAVVHAPLSRMARSEAPDT
jgi:hypothetical protein